MDCLTVDAHAKINLTLDITGKRADGYHLLRMAMQSVSLCDTLTLSRAQSGGIRLACRDKEVPMGSENTVFRAAERFFRYCGLNGQNVRIELQKTIPSQAGLGGASADAAAALRALNLLFETGLTLEELCGIGLEVGADVPFCLLGGTLLAEGIGERLAPLPPLPDCWIVLCKPNVSVCTKEAFALADGGEIPYEPHTDRMAAALKTGKLEAVCGALGNHFEAVLRLPEIESLKREMKALGAMGASMTGSGSVVFGLFQQEAGAQNCKGELLKTYREIFVCRPFFPGIE